MDQGSTNNGLTLSTRRFQEKADVRITSAFKGTTKTGFSEGISKHWQILSGHLFRPVHMQFRKQANHFGLLRLAGRRRSKVVHYTFSPRIQLQLSVNPTNNVFFETNTRHMLQSLETSVAWRAGKTFLASPLVREFWASFSEFKDRQGGVSRHDELMRVMSFTSNRRLDQRSERSRADHVKTTLMLMRRVNLTERTAQGASDGPRAPAQPVRFYVSIPLVMQNSKHSINQSLIRAAGITGETERLPGTPGFQLAQALSRLPIVFNRGLGWTRLSFQNFPENSGSTKLFSLLTVLKNGTASVMNQTLLKHLTIPGTHPGPTAAASSFTSVSLTLARKVDGVENVTPHTQRFPLSPSLSYVRHDTNQLQTVVNALRDLRHSQSETKVQQPAPQLPSIEQLTSQVCRQLERELRIEKERRGL